MLAFLLGLFRMVWLFGKDHRGVVLENLALRQQLSIYKRKHRRPRFVDRDRWFWVTLSVLWKDWRRASVVVHPDTVVRWQRERFRRYRYHLSKRPGKTGRGGWSKRRMPSHECAFRGLGRTSEVCNESMANRGRASRVPL